MKKRNNTYDFDGSAVDGCNMAHATHGRLRGTVGREQAAFDKMCRSLRTFDFYLPVQ